MTEAPRGADFSRRNCNTFPTQRTSAESQLHTSPLVGEVGARSAPGEGIGVEDAAGFAFTLSPTPLPSRGRGSKRAAGTHANWIP